uniref:Uncharacterized protein n=1 Tax=Tanacetum cinerariifolium TaxID=118510 RepID=A0A699IVF8_TANCI|nr:hypothetical protein [Tanacetum cinerariifolium]
MAVIWNPTVRKYVGIVILNALDMYIVIGFGVCPDTSDPKLVKISVIVTPSMWVVEVFTLRLRSNYIIPFDLKTKKFGEVSLPEKLVYIQVGCGEDGENKPFTKIYTIKVECKPMHHSILGFRKNSEVVLEMKDDNNEGSEIEVYEPLSGHINGVGINGDHFSFSVGSYMET